MSFDANQLLQEMRSWNIIKNAVVLRTESILFSDTIRKYCERNACGYYGSIPYHHGTGTVSNVGLILFD
ncbi:MAG TPA: hypothetical protein DCQ14_03255 [Firmicutes bacterium]|nr:hypothetical protein [Bacillota bacterium]